MMKFIIEVINAPYRKETPNTLSSKESKFCPVNRPMMGDKILSVNDVTMAENAAPIIIPTARFITLPRNTKSLKSFMKFFNMFSHPFTSLLYHILKR